MTAASTDPNWLFTEAQRIFASGDGAGAIGLLDRLPATLAEDGQVLHFRALALKKAGRADDAKAAFERALNAAPRDPQLANNYANLLMQTGMTAAALTLYESAIEIKPDYRDAHLNRVLALQALGRLDEALAGIDALIASGSTDARIHSARGTILLGLNRHDEAVNAFDQSLAMGHELPTALHGRARLALERGEANASARYRRAQAAIPGDPEILLGMAEALESEGDPAGIALLSEAVAARPDWTAGLERFARMRAEAGDVNFTGHYQLALGTLADQRGVRMSLARVLADADKHKDALEALAPLPDDRDLRVLRAFYIGEAGAPDQGLALLDGREDGEALMIAGRLALATGDIDRALPLLERSVEATPNAIAAWAHCELAWRAAGDPRAEWLSGQEALIATRKLGLNETEIGAVGELLRGLHRTNAHPIGQSLRGGTQTRGRLFRRQEPEIRRLHDALNATIADYIAALPPRDLRHPLLKYRDEALTIAGSWSVRLTDSGFHVHHIHPEGLLSSACYMALPQGVAGSATREGWLEIGRPPSTLNMALEPIATIEPMLGRLALFPSYLYHGTRPFTDGERLTVAFDVIAA